MSNLPRKCSTSSMWERCNCRMKSSNLCPVHSLSSPLKPGNTSPDPSIDTGLAASSSNTIADGGLGMYFVVGLDVSLAVCCANWVWISCWLAVASANTSGIGVAQVLDQGLAWLSQGFCPDLYLSAQRWQEDHCRLRLWRPCRLLSCSTSLSAGTTSWVGRRCTWRCSAHLAWASGRRQKPYAELSASAGFPAAISSRQAQLPEVPRTRGPSLHSQACWTGHSAAVDSSSRVSQQRRCRPSGCRRVSSAKASLHSAMLCSWTQRREHCSSDAADEWYMNHLADSIMSSSSRRPKVVSTISRGSLSLGHRMTRLTFRASATSFGRMLGC
mmetsp:Transcript_177338/g.568614  ORF Transcript_177338/g.568614 Transcript_177338/m.568614 type:complete len:328 (+) Transcript_177338:2252-3235(+)